MGPGRVGADRVPSVAGSVSAWGKMHATLPARGQDFAGSAVFAGADVLARCGLTVFMLWISVLLAGAAVFTSGLAGWITAVAVLVVDLPITGAGAVGTVLVMPAGAASVTGAVAV